MIENHIQLPDRDSHRQNVFKDELKPPSSHPKCVPDCAFSFPSAPFIPLTVGFLLGCVAPRCKCSSGSSLSAGACLPARCVASFVRFVTTSCSLRCLPVRTGKRLRLPLARCRRAKLKGALSLAHGTATCCSAHEFIVSLLLSCSQVQPEPRHAAPRDGCVPGSRAPAADRGRSLCRQILGLPSEYFVFNFRSSFMVLHLLC